LELTKEEESALKGEKGETLQLAYRILVATGEATNAEKLVPIQWAHVSGVNYNTIGDAGQEFLSNLSKDAKVKVKTTVNPMGFDIDNVSKGMLTSEAMWDRTFHKSDAPVHMLNHYKKVFGDRLFICGHSPWGPLYNDNHGVKRQLIDGGSKGGGYLYAAIVEDNQVIEIVKE